MAAVLDPGLPVYETAISPGACRSGILAKSPMHLKEFWWSRCLLGTNSEQEAAGSME
jgi:hypothetical protein